MTGLSAPGDRLAIISDVHGRLDMVHGALGQCREAGVGGIVLLGDLFDRADEADGCVDAFTGWPVFGVAGNHEREALAGVTMRPATAAFFAPMDERYVLGDVLFAHETPRIHHDAHTAFFHRRDFANGHQRAHESEAHLPHREREPFRVIFVGHTHHRSARDQHGPLHIGQELRLRAGRRYVINPGALVSGEFAIWDRAADLVLFRRVGTSLNARF